MTDDEKQSEDESQDPQDEAPQDEAPADETPAPEADEAPAEEADAPAEEEENGEDSSQAASGDDDDELPWKEKRRLERSRQPHEPGPQRSPEERAARRVEVRAAKARERRKQRAATRARDGAPGTGTPPAARDANAAKVRQGIVVSDKGEKSITVRIDIVRRHPTYEKVVRRSRTLHAHDERNEAGEGDMVRVVETRPLSKTKRWRLVEVLEKAK
jgi:small subunit ribosomal protein S17